MELEIQDKNDFNLQMINPSLIKQIDSICH